MHAGTQRRRRAWLVLLLAAMAAAVLAGSLALRSARMYQAALGLEEIGEYSSAYNQYERLGSYRDSAQRLEALRAQHPGAVLAGAEKGDLVTFGRYDQDGNGTATPLTWYVLDQGDGRLLLLSQTCLRCLPYQETMGNITWAGCSLRLWLNGDFLEEAFSATEQAAIAAVRNENPDEATHGTDGGPDTEDQVFILSGVEAQAYLASEENRDLSVRRWPAPGRCWRASTKQRRRTR